MPSEMMSAEEEIAVLQMCRAACVISIEGGGVVVDAIPERMRPVVYSLDPGYIADDLAPRHVKALPALDHLSLPLSADLAILDALPAGINSLTLRDTETVHQVGRRLEDPQWAPKLRSIEAQVGDEDDEVDYSDRDGDSSMYGVNFAREEAEMLGPICRQRGIMLDVY